MMALSTRRNPFRVQTKTLSPAEAAAKKITLEREPSNPNLVLLFIKDSGTHLTNLEDFQIVGSELSWAGYEMDGVLDAGDKLSVLMP